MRISDTARAIFYMTLLIFVASVIIWIWDDVLNSYPPMNEISIQSNVMDNHNEYIYYHTNKSEIFYNPNGDITVTICYTSLPVSLYKKLLYKEYDNKIFKAGTYIILPAKE